MILMQHLDPNHGSLMVDLLATRTKFTGKEALEGAEVLRDHLYIIPPGRYLPVRDGRLHLEPRPERHSARMPFDLLLQSLATSDGPNTTGVVLSGTGADGSVGLATFKRTGGSCIAQDPKEAGCDAMPANAIAAGAIDAIATAADIPGIILSRLREHAPRTRRLKSFDPLDADTLANILEILKRTADHDYGAYKQGTVRRRVERRMALSGLFPGSMDQYLKLFHSDEDEQQQLPSDLLINVTSFFRDHQVFEYLSEHVLPELIADHPADTKLRVWPAGCSTGEGSYSLGMLFKEAIEASGRDIAVQIFASDADADAVSTARLGIYPDTIAQSVSAKRLARFFAKDGQSYRVLPEFRSMVAFLEQNVLSDPAFSRLDLISCRNLMIYLSSEAQGFLRVPFRAASRGRAVTRLGRNDGQQRWRI